jgi:serine protease Do
VGLEGWHETAGLDKLLLGRILASLLDTGARVISIECTRNITVTISRQFRPNSNLLRSPWLASCVGAATCLLLATGLGAQAPPEKQTTDILRQLSDSFEALARRVSPSVVQILVTGFGPVEADGITATALVARQHITGSGVIVDASGYIITNAHVVAGAQRVRVVVPSRTVSGSPRSMERPPNPPIDARIIGLDEDIDLAVLKVEAKDLPALPLGNYEALRKGQLVLAFGSPEGLENSVTMGVVSSVARQPDPDRPMVYIQTDAPINPGNSGGPLVDVNGNIVGINTFILTKGGGSEGLGFAIPSSVVKFAYPQLRKFGHVHRGEIGINVQTVTPALAAGLGLAQDHGVIVSDMVAGGPADSAGLKIGDLILAVDGRSVVSLTQFAAIMYLRAGGESVKFDVIRGPERFTLEIPVAERRDEADRMADLDPEKNLIPKLGILGVAIDKKISDALPGLRMASGVVVAARAAYAASVESGLQSGDVIHALNGIDIISLEGLRQTLDKLKTGDPIVLQVERQGRLMYLAFDME